MSLDKYRVAVLGSGPAGLLAAHASIERGLKPDILSVKRKSRTGGAMYLHYPIEGLTGSDPEATVTYHKRGDARTYARKVYGTEEVGSIVSFNRFADGASYPAWNLVELYDVLWDRWEPYIQDLEVTPAILAELLKEYDAILSTVPLDRLCRNSSLHEFPGQTVWIAPENVGVIPPNSIVYNGTEEGSWYRQSRLFGWEGTEWGAGISAPPLSNVVQVHKPIGTNCDCWDDSPGFAKLGRFGRWDKHVLTHDAHQAAGSFLDRLKSGGVYEVH